MIETETAWVGNLRELLGMTLKRDDVIVKVRSISIRDAGHVYIHPGDPSTFGWTFLMPDGTLCGKWSVVGKP